MKKQLEVSLLEAVEFDLANPLVIKFRIDEEWQLVEYESLLQICYSYGRGDHNLATCPHKPTVQEDPTYVDPVNFVDNSMVRMVREDPSNRGGTRNYPWLHSSIKAYRNNKKVSPINMGERGWLSQSNEITFLCSFKFK